jgi:hypothetical protein
MGGSMRGAVRLLVVAAFVAASARAHAQVCADPDGNGDVTVTDGVEILRAAAGLSATCSPTICDVNGDGLVTVTDAVNTLRRAAGLTATFSCGTGISNFISDVQVAGGDHAVLEVGAAPIPAASAPDSIGSPQGSADAVAGGSNTVTVPYSAGSTSQASAAMMGGGLSFVVAVADLQGNLTDGIFEVPLDKSAGQLQIQVAFPRHLGQASFFLYFATRNDGMLSQYGTFRQDPVSAQPVPTPKGRPGTNP